MNPTAAKKFDTSKLSPRDRRSFENGMALVEKKLAAARLAQIALQAVPRSFRIVPPTSPKEFSTRRPATVMGQVRTHVVFQTFAD
jgi:hypothetical protein